MSTLLSLLLVFWIHGYELLAWPVFCCKVFYFCFSTIHGSWAFSFLSSWDLNYWDWKIVCLLFCESGISQWDIWNTKGEAFDSVLCTKCFQKNWWEYMFFVIYQLFHWWSKGMAVLIIWSEPCFGSWSLDGMPVFCIMC